MPLRAVFICSAGHSGSTLLDLLLGSHPDAVSLGEITHLPKNLALNTPCTCGALARECELWSRVVSELAASPPFHGIEADPYVLNLGMICASDVVDPRHQTTWRMLQRRFVYALAYARHRWGAAVPSALTRPLQTGGRNKLALFELLSRLLARTVMIDSSKHYLEAVSLYEQSPEQVRVVLLVRDGRAVYYSGIKRGQHRNTAMHAWASTYRRALPILRRRIPAAHLIEVRYEDLVEQPERELERLCRFIGIEYSPEMLRFAEKTHHVLNGNRMRFGTGKIRADSTWRERLDNRDLAYFDSRVGRLNRELGYR